ncbi:SH3-like domain-containing protein [Azospirillum rugosum]|uniref:Nitrile hydratase n=1 Tax=Azospirillum rugosum TaxID=416170 RepID=A0ABS4SV49_9PROT|nr:SH3-like domain-containing protein [Azospirillum rugosum]MBP2296451.1 nitrile hydratase [Azospirillum rugosum]MDQ0529972.1 nitrile hydratase [Azospirillum rugosum]
MPSPTPAHGGRIPGVVPADGEEPAFAPGDAVRIRTLSPVGHYRVPLYLRGKAASVEAVIRPAAIDNEEEGYGRNAGSRRHYYRVAVPMTAIWADYRGNAADSLRIEVFETWLERI